ncbi:MAG: hypothetical protein FJY17_07200 [Bacteroidetes bacterium]|nr:hypothetical protein [Bacteroidota bacterium]
MNKLIFSYLISSLIFLGCTGVKTTSYSLESEAFLEFIGNPYLYDGGIDIQLDHKFKFKAVVNKENADRPKGTVYSISPGNHLISVSHNGKMVYQKQVYISYQETKRIILP